MTSSEQEVSPAPAPPEPTVEMRAADSSPAAALGQSERDTETIAPTTAHGEQLPSPAVGQATELFRDAASDSPTDDAMTDNRHDLPRRIGKFRIVRELGRGGMGMVFEAIQEDVQRKVALKVPGRLSDEDQLRFEWEARILAQIQDPNIATLYEHGTADDELGRRRPYFAMEYVSGSTLNDYVREQSLAPRAIVALMRDIAAASGRAHRRGIVHRDLKPGNILIDQDGIPHILDFGVARFTEGRPDELKTMAGQIVGTVLYMAPEQARGDSDRADAASDVYALGTILYELLAQRHPLPLAGRLLVEMLTAIEQEPPVPLGQVDRRLAGDLSLIVDKSLRKEPAQRYASGTELADDLGRWLDDAPIVARPATTAYQLRKWIQRHRAFASFLASLVAIALVAAMLIVQAWQQEKTARKDAEESGRQAIAARDKAERARRGELEQSLIRFQQRGDWKAVLETIQKLEALPDVNRDQLGADRAMAHFVLGQYEQARSITAELTKRETQLGSSLARVRLCRALIAQTVDGDTPEALRMIRGAKEAGGLSPGDNKFADAFLATTRDDAERHLRDGLKAEPLNYLCLTHLTMLTVTSGDEREAESLIQLGEQLFPIDPSFLEGRASLAMRRTGSINREELREAAMRRMDATLVERTLDAIESNISMSQLLDRFFVAAMDENQDEMRKLQTQILLQWPKLLKQQATRRTSASAPLPAMDAGMGELFRRLPLAMIGIGREDTYAFCRDRYLAMRDPFILQMGIFLRLAGSEDLDSLSTETLQELDDLAADGANRPSVLRRIPTLMRYMRLILLTQLAIRSEKAGDVAKTKHIREQMIHECRVLLESPLVTSRQRTIAIAALAGASDFSVEVRAIGDLQLRNAPQDADLQTLVAITETMLGNPERAERLLRTDGMQNRVSEPLKRTYQAALDRARTLRNDQAAKLQSDFESRRGDALREILKLSQSYDRQGRRRDAELAAQAAAAACDQLLAKIADERANRSARAELLGIRAIARWRLNDLGRSCDDTLAAIAAAPDDHWPAFVGAPRLLLAGRRDDYLRVARNLLEKYAQADDPMLCERVAKVALFAPDPSTLPSAAVAAVRAKTLGENHRYRVYFELAAGMALVREGKYDATAALKSGPFATRFHEPKFIRFPAIILHALGAVRSPQHDVARQRLLEIAPYFSQLELPLLAHDHDLQGQLAFYREAAATYGLQSDLDWKGGAEWKIPRAIAVNDRRGQSLTAAEEGAFFGDYDAPSDFVRFDVELEGPITALRLEALPDAKLPQGGPGSLVGTGRCRINEVQAYRVNGDEKTELSIVSALPAGGESTQGFIGQAFDKDPLSDWGPDYDDRFGQPLDGIFRLAAPVTLQPGERLRVEVHSRHPFGVPVRLRLRTTSSP